MKIKHRDRQGKEVKGWNKKRGCQHTNNYFPFFFVSLLDTIDFFFFFPGQSKYLWYAGFRLLTMLRMTVNMTPKQVKRRREKLPQPKPPPPGADAWGGGESTICIVFFFRKTRRNESKRRWTEDESWRWKQQKKQYMKMAKRDEQKMKTEDEEWRQHGESSWKAEDEQKVFLFSNTENDEETKKRKERKRN